MHAAVPYSSQQAGGAQSRTIPYRSRRFGIGSSLGYAAFEWLGSTWCLRGWSQQPPGITPMPATQPLSKRPLKVPHQIFHAECFDSYKSLYRNQVLQLKTAPETPFSIRCSPIFSVYNFAASAPRRITACSLAWL